MAEIFLALVLAVVMVAGAELVRLTCRRQLTAPARLHMQRVPAMSTAEIE